MFELWPYTLVYFKEKEKIMNKTRKIISVIMTVAMMMSMIVMCLPVSAEETVTAAGTEWKFNIGIGEAGSAATLSDGPFSLESKAGVLKGTVETFNGVASIVTEDGKRAFSKSANGIIDITPSKSTITKIVFTAPATGKYLYDVSAVLATTTKTASLWTEIGKYVEGFNGTDPAWGYKNAGITNGTKTWAYNTDRLETATTVMLNAGETIVLSVEADAGENGKTDTDETQLTVNKFNVTFLYDPATADEFAYDSANPQKVNGNYTLAGVVTGAEGAADTLDYLDEAAIDPWWNASGNYLTWHASEGRGFWAREDGKYPHFTVSQTGCLIDATPEIQAPSVILYTAPKTGTYSFSGIFVKNSVCETTISIAPDGDFTNLLVASEKSRVAGATISISETVQLKEGAQLWIKIATTDKNEQGSFEVGVNSIAMIYESSEYTEPVITNPPETSTPEDTTAPDETDDPDDTPDDEYRVGQRFKYEIDITKKEKGFFKLAGVKTGNNKLLELEDSIRAAWGDENFPGRFLESNSGVYLFSKTQAEGCWIDMSPKARNDAVIIFTAPVDGKYGIIGEFTKLKLSEDGPKYEISLKDGDNILDTHIFEATADAGDQDALVSGTVWLKAGETVMFVASHAGGSNQSAEIAVRNIEVQIKALGTEEKGSSGNNAPADNNVAVIIAVVAAVVVVAGVVTVIVIKNKKAK